MESLPSELPKALERTYLKIPLVQTRSGQATLPPAPLDALEAAKWTLFENAVVPTALAAPLAAPPDAPPNAQLDALEEAKWTLFENALVPTALAAPLDVTLDTSLVLMRLQPRLDSLLYTPLDAPALHLALSSLVHATAEVAAPRLLNLRHLW